VDFGRPGSGPASVALLLVLLASGCGGSPAKVASNLPRALHRLDTARTGIVTTNLVFSGEGETAPPIVYVTRFDNVRKRADTALDLSKFIRVYNTTISASERVGTPDEWHLELVTDSLRGLVLYMRSPLFNDPSFQRGLPANLRHKPWLQLSVPELPAFFRKILAGSSSAMAARIWVDGSSVVRRIEFRSRVARDVNVVDTTDLSRMGTRIAIPLPPKSQVLDVAKLPQK
jgi:hypothetical protein